MVEIVIFNPLYQYATHAITIRRYDRLDSRDRSYKFLTDASRQRLGRLFKAYRAYCQVTPNVYDNHVLDFDPMRRNHYAELHCQPLDDEGRAAMIGRNGRPIVGRKWEISEDEYWYALEVLPPIYLKGGGFAMREFHVGNITTKYSETADGRYFAEWIEFKPAITQAIQGGLI